MPHRIAEIRLRYERELFKAFHGERTTKRGWRIPPREAIGTVRVNIWKRVNHIGALEGDRLRRWFARPLDRLAEYLDRRAAAGRSAA